MNLIVHPSTVPLSQRKTLCGPGIEDRVWREALAASKGVDLPTPVYWGSRCIGWACADHYRKDYVWHGTNADWLKCNPFANYDDVIRAMTASTPQRLSAYFSKIPQSSHVTGSWYDMWPTGGCIGQGPYGGSAFNSKRHDDTELGSLPHGGNVSPKTKHLMGAWAWSTNGALQTMIIYDRVLTYEACTYNSNVNQTFTTSQTALRYQNAGDGGLKICLTQQTAGGATAANITQLRYMNQDGTDQRVMDITRTVGHIVSAAAPTENIGARITTPADASATVSWDKFLPLQIGDYGATLIDDWTTSALPTGTVCFILARPLGYAITFPAANPPVIHEMIQQVRGAERVLDGACLSFLAFFPGGNLTNFNGDVEFAWV